MFELDESGICHQFTKEAKKLSFKIQIEKTIKAQDIEDIIVTGFEGGCTYWMGLDNSTPIWDNQPEDLPNSQYVTQLLLRGEKVKLFDIEDEDETWELTLEKLLQGMKLNAEQRPHDCDLDNMDATTADCIIQYALFNEVVYG